MWVQMNTGDSTKSKIIGKLRTKGEWISLQGVRAREPRINSCAQPLKEQYLESTLLVDNTESITLLTIIILVDQRDPVFDKRAHKSQDWYINRLIYNAFQLGSA